nr:hypothetical protein [uncultured Blautia sp.]
MIAFNINNDKRLGDECYIDGVDVYVKYGADLKEFYMLPGAITLDCKENTGQSGFNVFSDTLEGKGAVMVFYVCGHSNEDLISNVSNLILACRKCVVQTASSRFEFPAVMTEYSIEATGVEFYNLVTINLMVIKRLPLVTEKLTGAGIITNPGNQESGMRLEITPANALSSFTIEGITIKNLKAKETFILDGIEGEVTVGGINRFQDTDLIDFPKIKPGMNEITMSANVPVRISFYPVFL